MKTDLRLTTLALTTLATLTFTSAGFGCGDSAAEEGDSSGTDMGSETEAGDEIGDGDGDTTGDGDGDTTGDGDGDGDTTGDGDGDTTGDGDGDTTGGAVCEPSDMDTECDACLKDQCCAELEACAANEDCTCLSLCFQGGGGQVECFQECGIMGQPPAEVFELGGCIEASCADVCA